MIKNNSTVLMQGFTRVGIAKRKRRIGFVDLKQWTFLS